MFKSKHWPLIFRISCQSCEKSFDPLSSNFTSQ
jgi:hypothetical protein